MKKEQIFPHGFLKNVKNFGLRSEQRRRLKTLSGFEKQSRHTEKKLAQEEGAIVRIAQTDIEEDIENQFALIRDGFGYRRKDLEVSIESGHGSIRTPAFEYQILIVPDPEDPTSVIWRREMTCFGQISTTENFQTVFGDLFDTVFCELLEIAPIAMLIDDLEEREPEGIKLDYDSRCTWCEIKSQKFPGTIRMQHNQLTISGSANFGASELCDLLAPLQVIFDDRKLSASSF